MSDLTPTEPVVPRASVPFLVAARFTLYGLVVARRRLLRPPPGELPPEERERLQSAYLVTGFLLALVAYLATGVFLHLAYIRFFYLMLALAGAAAGIASARSHPSPNRERATTLQEKEA